MHGVARLKNTRTDAKDRQSEYTTRPYAYLLPTLFDRLKDDAPFKKDEAPGEYSVSRQQLRDIVLRDLAYLLNTSNIEDLIDCDRYPDVAASTVNFGMPALAGSYLSEDQWAHIEQHICRAIIYFEPRLVPDSLQVTPLMKNGSANRYNILLFEIRGLIAMNPYPMAFMVHSAVDLETNQISMTPISGK